MLGEIIQLYTADVRAKDDIHYFSVNKDGEDGQSRRYGRGYMLQKRAEAMNRIRYRDLDLSHLLP